MLLPIQISLVRLFVSTSTAVFVSDEIGTSKQNKAIFNGKPEAFVLDQLVYLAIKGSFDLPKKNRD